jgi:RNA polymerase sigma factor (sigma-70 family)
MRILTLCGSLRARSSNRAILRAYERVGEAGMVFEHYEGMGALPHFNPDLDDEAATAPREVAELRAAVDRADVVVISTPEYVHALPGSFKNLLDWLVSHPPFAGKRVAILHASRDSRWALDSLREVLRTMAANILDEASVALPLGSNRLDENAILAREDLRALLGASMKALAVGHAIRTGAGGCAQFARLFHGLAPWVNEIFCYITRLFGTAKPNEPRARMKRGSRERQPLMNTLSPTHSSTSTSETPGQVSPARAEAQADMGLIRRFLAGYRPMVFNKAMLLLRSRGDAEEIAQDTFVRAYRGLATFRGDSSLATWLYRIAVNLSRNRYWHMFRRRRFDTVSLDVRIGDEQTASLSDLIASEAADPAQESASGEFAEAVKECMTKLEAPHREILELCTEKHLSYDEISAQLGINVGTVKSRIARARKCLRTFLNAHCPAFADANCPTDYFLMQPPQGAMGLAA